MLSNRFLKPVLILTIVILSLLAGLTVFFFATPNKEEWQSFIPELNKSDKTISTLVVFNESDYGTGLQLTIRSLQGIINSQLPDGKALFVVNKPQDSIILEQLYAKQNKFTIYQFPNGNSSLTNLANLINYFKGVIKGFVYFDAKEKIIIPGIINFLSYYQNTIAIPYPMLGILPGNYSFLQMYNFLNLTNSSSALNLSNFYQNQIDSFSSSLSGVNIWNSLTDQESYFDYIINQKYLSFPIDLLNGSFPIIQDRIENLISSHINKPIANIWPTTISKLPVPVYRNISDVSNLSILSRPFSFTSPFESTFQKLFIRNILLTESSKISSAKSFNYSLILNSDGNTVNFIYSYVVPILAENSSLLNNFTIIIDDSTIALIPDVFYWILTNYPSIHFMPKILLNNPIEPIYFPKLFTNQTAYVIQKTDKFTNSEWTNGSYVNTLENHFIGSYTNSSNHINSIFNLPIKKVYSTFSSVNDTSETQFLYYLQAVIQENTPRNFVLLFTGQPNFLSSTIFNFRLAMQKTEFSMNTLFVCYSASQLFNKIT